MLSQSIAAAKSQFHEAVMAIGYISITIDGAKIPPKLLIALARLVVIDYPTVVTDYDYSCWFGKRFINTSTVDRWKHG